MKVRIDSLRPGDMIDLEKDCFADPNNENHILSYEYALVDEIEHETTECVVVHFTNTESVGFPPSHLVKRST